MKDKIRYIVKDLGDGNYEFTHLEKFETLEGKEVEIVKGKNILTVDKLNDGIARYTDVLENQEKQLEPEVIKELIEKHKEDLTAEVELTKQHIETMHEMLKAIETL